MSVNERPFYDSNDEILFEVTDIRELVQKVFNSYEKYIKAYLLSEFDKMNIPTSYVKLFKLEINAKILAYCIKITVITKDGIMYINNKLFSKSIEECLSYMKFKFLNFLVDKRILNLIYVNDKFIWIDNKNKPKRKAKND